MRHSLKNILIALVSMFLLCGLGIQQQRISTGFNVELMAAQAQTTNTATFFASLQPHHVALSVPNLDETIQWYQEKLGFTTTLRRNLPQFSTRQAFLALEPVADEELGLTVCFIKDNNGNLIELVQELNTL